jgi:hypothetical protein
MAARAITTYINAIVQDSILNKGNVIDNIFEGNPGLDWFWTMRERQVGGERCNWIFYRSDPQQGQTISLYEDYLVAPVDDELQASIIWADYIFPLVLSKTLLKKVTGKDGLINLTLASMEKTRKSAKAQLSQDLYGVGDDYAHPVFNGKTNANPLFGIDGIVGVDRTYAGFDSTTYTQLDSTVVTIDGSTYADMYSSSDANYLPDAMENVITETDFDDGDKGINKILTTKIGLEALKRAVGRGDAGQAASTVGGMRIDGGYPKDGVAKAGVTSFWWGGIPVNRDNKCTAGRMFFLNSDTMYMKVLAGSDMTYEPAEPNSAGDSIVGNFSVSAQIICTEPRRQGKITGISTDRT